MEPAFVPYRNTLCRFEEIILPAPLRFVALSWQAYPNFANIQVFHDRYQAQFLHSLPSYTEIGFSCQYGENQWDYYFGCLVNEPIDLPEELTLIETDLTRFLCVTFRSPSTEALVGGEGPGEGMQDAEAFLRERWLSANRAQTTATDEDSLAFRVNVSGKPCTTGLIEIYPHDIQTTPEMCFYIPLRSD